MIALYDRTLLPHLGPPLIALFLQLCIFYIMKYFLMLWHTCGRHNVPLDVPFIL